MKNKLRAFTVIELVVALVLTAVVVSIGYLGMRTLTAQFGELADRNRTADVASRLNAALRADARQAFAIRITDAGLVFDGDRIPAVHYEMRDSLVVRISNPGGEEAFAFAVDSLTYAFRGKHTTGPEALVDRVVLWCRRGTQPFTFTITKNYDAATLMRLTTAQDEWD